MHETTQMHNLNIFKILSDIAIPLSIATALANVIYCIEYTNILDFLHGTLLVPLL